MNTDVNAASIGVNMDTIEAIQTEYDVFSREGDNQEIILDTCGIVTDSPEMKRLSELLGQPASELQDRYLIIWLNH